MLANLETLLGEVERRDAHLLNTAERAELAAFWALPQAARALWARLVSRVGPWIRVESLVYAEVGPTRPALEILLSQGFAVEARELPASERLQLLRRQELLEVAQGAAVGVPRSARRGLLLERLAAAAIDGGLHLEPARWVRACRTEILDVARVLFFGSLDRDWTEWLLRDLGVLRWVPYRIDEVCRLFASRAQLDGALALRRLVRDLEREGQPNVDETAARIFACLDLATELTARDRRLANRLLARVGQAFERVGRLEEALATHGRADGPPARERVARVLAALQRRDEAIACCRTIAAAPHDEVEREFAVRFAARLEGRREPRVVAWLSLEVEVPSTGEPIERRVAAALAPRGVAVHSENHLWRAAFGLLLWDVIFDDAVAGVFLHPFQLGPNDLHAPEFRRARAAAIATRLDLVANRSPAENYAAAIAAWETHQGLASELVVWEPWLREQLDLALPRVPSAVLAAVCDRLATDLGRFRRGFPDLFVARPDGGFELHEVKGPGDQLRPEQRGWLAFLAGQGVSVWVTRARLAPAML